MPKTLTEEMLNKQMLTKEYFEEPEILSRTDKKYKRYVILLAGEVIGNLDSLCNILMNPLELIFTESNKMELQCGSPEIRIEREHTTERHSLGDGSTLILRGIRDGKWDKNAVLHDLCKMCGCFSKEKYPYMHKLNLEIYNFLLKESYLKWLS